MAMYSSWITLNPNHRAELDDHFGQSGWRVISPEQLPSAFPSGLRSKVASAVVITAPTSTGGTYYVISAWRLDRNKRTAAFDNEPIGLIVHSTGASSEAVILHHGDWKGRTSPIPDSLVRMIEDEGVGDYLWAVPPANRQQGDLDELPVPHRGAFQAVVREIRTKIDHR